MKDHASEGLTCWDVTGRASEYLDDHLPTLTKVQVDLHLASCAHCRAYVKQIDLVSSTLRSLPKLYPSPVNHLCLPQPSAAHHGQSAAGY
jgi:predicted anti-sigma-YlaC factor YlaD